MTDRTWDYNSLSAGTTITSSNHAATDAATSTVSPGTGGTTVADATHILGSSGCALKQTNGTGAVGIVRWTLAAGASACAWRGFVYYEDLPSAATRTIFSVRSAAGEVARVTMSTAGVLQWQRGSSATTSPGTNIGTASSSGIPVADAMMRWECTADVASGAVSDLVFNVYDGNTSTLLGAATCTNVDLYAVGGDYTVTQFESGAKAQDPSLPIWFEHCTTRDSAATLIGAVSSVPPTAIVTHPVDNVIDASGSTDGGGGTLAFAIAQDSGTTVTEVELAEGIWAIPQTSTTSDWTVTVTESPGSLTDTATVTIPALAGGDTGMYVWTGSAWE